MLEKNNLKYYKINTSITNCEHRDIKLYMITYFSNLLIVLEHNSDRTPLATDVYALYVKYTY